MPPPFKIEPLGEAAFILRELTSPAWQVANWIDSLKLPGLIEAVAAYETVGLYVDESTFDPTCLLKLPESDLAPTESKLHEIPVCYEFGDDLADAAQRLGISSDFVIAEHLSVVYHCAAIGFCPGFPYLHALPQSIAGLPRRATPRVRVMPGSVGITGNQTGIYPLPRPGGWNLIGRTPMTLVDVDDDYFPIKAGDRLQFLRIDCAEFARLEGERLVKKD